MYIKKAPTSEYVIHLKSYIIHIEFKQLNKLVIFYFVKT